MARSKVAKSSKNVTSKSSSAKTKSAKKKSRREQLTKPKKTLTDKAVGAEEQARAKRKKTKYSRRTTTLRRMRAAQKSTKSIVPLAALIREIHTATTAAEKSLGLKKPIRWKGDAVIAIRAVIEARLEKVLREATRVAGEKRKTVNGQDCFTVACMMGMATRAPQEVPA